MVRDLSSWIVRYDAKVMGTTATLTPEKANKKGSVWLAVPAGFSSFEVAFDLRIAGTPPDADGLTLSWIVAGAGDPAPDSSGSTLNLPTRPGYAVAFDTFPAPTVLLLDGSATNLADNTNVLAKTLASAPLSVTHDWQPVVVRFELGKLTAAWSGGAPLSAQLAGATMSTTYLGFTAATGGADSEHAVRAVRVAVAGSCL